MRPLAQGLAHKARIPVRLSSPITSPNRPTCAGSAREKVLFKPLAGRCDNRACRQDFRRWSHSCWAFPVVWSIVLACCHRVSLEGESWSEIGNVDSTTTSRHREGKTRPFSSRRTFVVVYLDILHLVLVCSISPGTTCSLLVIEGGLVPPATAFASTALQLISGKVNTRSKSVLSHHGPACPTTFSKFENNFGCSSSLEPSISPMAWSCTTSP